MENSTKCTTLKQERTPEQDRIFDLIEQMFHDAPPSIPRQEVCRRMSNAITPKTIANNDSLGTGIAGRFYCGRKALYPTANVIEWLKNRTTSN